MANNIADILSSTASTEKLIDLMQESPCLYDITRADYMNRDLKNSKWEAIFHQLLPHYHTLRGAEKLQAGK